MLVILRNDTEITFKHSGYIKFTFAKSFKVKSNGADGLLFASSIYRINYNLFVYISPISLDLRWFSEAYVYAIKLMGPIQLLK